MTTIDDLISRARAFRSTSFVQKQPLYDQLVRDGQAPKILMIACSDSRVDPSVIFDAEPGQIFMVRNVASLVPPSSPDEGCHGTSAALEFGVRALGVEHVVVLGHGHCGGIDALLDGTKGDDPTSEFIGPWLSCATGVCDQVVKEMPQASHAERARRLEYETVRMSVRNLMTFQWIAERVSKGDLSLHGWHFDIAEGVLSDVGESGDPVRISG